MTSVPEEKEKGTKHECKTEQKKYFRFAPFPFFHVVSLCKSPHDAESDRVWIDVGRIT